jgi:hypothetical protein
MILRIFIVFHTVCKRYMYKIFLYSFLVIYNEVFLILPQKNLILTYIIGSHILRIYVYSRPFLHVLTCLSKVNIYSTVLFVESCKRVTIKKL